jgi:hypothetical protein
MSETERINAAYWRERAAEVVISAGSLKDPEAKSLLLRIAQEYERLATRAEEREAKGESLE